MKCPPLFFSSSKNDYLYLIHIIKNGNANKKCIVIVITVIIKTAITTFMIHKKREREIKTRVETNYYLTSEL